MGERCKMAGLASIRSSPIELPSSYFRFLEPPGIIIRESDNPRGRMGGGNPTGDSCMEFDEAPVGGEAAVAAVLHLLDHGGGGGTFRSTIWCDGRGEDVDKGLSSTTDCDRDPGSWEELDSPGVNFTSSTNSVCVNGRGSFLNTIPLHVVMSICSVSTYMSTSGWSRKSGRLLEQYKAEKENIDVPMCLTRTSEYG